MADSMLFKKEVVLSGIRATGKMHLGNLLGALRYFAQLSRDETKQCYFFVANLHTLTTRIDAQEIKKDLKNIVLDFISVGVDPSRAVIFAQSSVPETSELNWLLSCLTYIPELERMPHFKDKKDKKESLGESISAGLLFYPVLMASDILGPKANLVPVGEDQTVHVEFARTLARRFNHHYGETLVVPKVVSHEAVRVPGLDGTGKMGKSENNTIDLGDLPEVIDWKVRKAMTDPARKRRTDIGNPEKCNVYTLHTLLSNDIEIKEVYTGCTTAGIGCIDCKKILIQNILNLLAPIQEKRKELENFPEDYYLQILQSGGIKARLVISETVREVKDKMGVPFY